MKPLRFQGIPIHPMLVHFPLAGWSVTAFLAWPGLYYPQLAELALWSNVLALVFAPVAVVAGIMEFLGLPDDVDVLRTANRHMLLAGTALVVFIASLVLQAKGMQVASAISSSVGFVVLLFAGHSGARLVYFHRIPAR